MDIKTLVNGGWGRHANETAAVASELEQHCALAETNEQAAALIQLGNHTIGEHFGQWPRACVLAEKVLANRKGSPVLAGSYAMLAVAQYMAGKPADALANEAHAVRLTDKGPVAVVINIRAMVGSALVFNKRTEEGARVFQAALALARAQEGKLACDITLAAGSHNLANELMQRKQRSSADDALMLLAAQASKEFWLKCGTWENQERGDYMLALVHNKLGQPDRALQCCARALEVIAANGEEVVDEAFVNLAIAGAHRIKQDRAAYKEALARADELAATFPDDGLKSWFAEERAKVEW